MKRFLTGAACALLAVAAGSAAGVTPPNYDRQALRPPVAGAAKAQALSRRLAARSPRANRGSRFVWASAGGPALPLSPMRADMRPEAAARNALTGAAGRLGLPLETVDGAELKELQDLGHGPVIARFAQKYQGLEIFGREMKVIMDRDLRPVAYSGSFAPLKAASNPVAASKASPSSYGAAASVTAATAVARALRDLSGASGAPGLQLAGDAPAATSVWYADRGSLIPAYKIRIRAAQADGAGIMSYGYVVSAQNGEVLVRKNFMADASYTYRVYANAASPFAPSDGPLGNARMPFAGTTPADNPARVAVSPSYVTLQNGPISTMDPWLANGATVTMGNNVDAYSDINFPDGINHDERAPMTGVRTFAWGTVADADPASSDARRGGIVNLFYVNNYLHDLWYDHGMTETAGVAQHSNLGRGGTPNDAMHAESQDYSGRNNANMDTPPDGISPTQQMFLFDGGTHSFTVTAPALGAYDSGVAGFGATVFDLSGDLAAVDDGSVAAGSGTGSVTDGCESFSGVSGKIALVDRGNCNFTVKGFNAQAAGASGVLVVNNVPQDGPVSMSGNDASITIPLMSVSIEDGAAIKAALGSGTVTVHMVRTAGADRDSALDNGIVAHEFFHYVSNRLIGDAFGLINQQGNGMGEGWSDFSSMLLMVRPDDTAVPGNSTYAGIYGLGVYVDDSAYYGVRRAPYSTDFSINPLTFQHIQEGVALPSTAPLAFGHNGVGNSEVHSTGEIWANVLWECYAALLNDSRYTFDQARSRMMDYIIGGLKMTPNAPTFLDARDAILSAVRASDAQDYVLFATAFAKRGMGAGAVAPDAYDDQQLGVVESYIALAQSYEITTPGINFQYDDGTVGYCDTDNILDPGETALLRFTVTSNGTQDLAAGATLQVSTDGNITLPNGGLVTLPALPIGASFDVTMPMTLASASGTAQLVTLTVAFPPAGGTPDAVIEPATYTRPLHVNFDLSKTRSFDDVELAEASEADWLVALTDPSGRPWTTLDADADFHTGRLWHGPDNASPNSSTLTSPSFHVNAGFSLGFDHYFEFEVPFDTGNGTIYFDGGRIEVSVDGGGWQDAVAFGASFTQGNGYNGASLAFNPNNPPQAFVDTNGNLESMALSFGNLLAGHDAQIRFRIEADESVGAFGWLVDNLMFTGASAPIFSTPVTEDGACVNTTPVVSAGSDASANEGTTVNLTGTATDRNGGTLTYAWTRVSGPAVTINNAATLTPNFVAPEVSTTTPLTLRLTVSDGSAQATDDVVITIIDTTVVAPPPSGGGGGGSLGGGEVALLGLLALLRRRSRSHA